MKIFKYLTITLILLIISCDAFNLEFNNPVDSKSDEYQGFVTVPDITKCTFSPEDGFEATSSTLTFNWDVVAGATGYWIEINTLSNFTGETIVNDNTLTTNSYTQVSELTSGSYYWHVKQNNNGNWGDWSEAYSFSIDLDNNDNSSIVPRDGLVAEYLFNGNANDTSGNNHHGTNYGATLTTDRHGNADSAYSFDGVNDYIEVEDFILEQNFTASFWVNIEDSTRHQGIISIFDTDIGTRFNINSYNEGGGSGDILQTLINDENSNFKKNLIEDFQSNYTNKWTNIVASYDKSSNIIKTYINGIETSDSNPLQGNLDWKGLTESIILGKTTNNYYYLDGKIDDVRIYDRVLTQSEVSTLYNEDDSSSDDSNTDTSSVPRDGLVAEYLFNGNANDSSGNGNNGTVYGATLTSDRDGNENSAYNFDGIDDYSILHFIEDYSFSMGTISISFKASEDNGSVLLSFSDESSTYYYFYIGNASSIILDESITININNNNFMVRNGEAFYLDNEWHQLILSSDGTSYKLYIDNINMTDSLYFLKGSNNGDWYDADSAFSDLRLAKHESIHEASTSQLVVDDIRVYNRDLSEEEIQSLFTSKTTSIPRDGLVGENLAWVGRNGHQSIVFNNKMWILGGRTGQNTFVNDIYSSTDGYNWILENSSPNWSARAFHTSIVFDNKIWILGGSGPTGTNDVWSSINGIDWLLETDSAGWGARAYHSSVVYNNKIWVMGGWNGSTDFSDVWSSSDGKIWNLETNSPGWDARHQPNSVVYNNKIWLMGGGIGGSSSTFNDVWSTTNGIDWILETNSPGWSNRSGANILEYKGLLWLIGGWDGTRKSELWYSDDGIVWDLYSNNPGWSPRSSQSSISYNNKIWIIGGYDTKYISDVWYHY